MKIEPQPTRNSVLALCAIGLILSLFGSWILEIRSADEAIYAFIAKGIEETGDWIHFSPQGNAVTAFPLYSWLVAILDSLGVPSVLSIRLPAILASWLLALGTGLMARKLKDSLSGFIAAAVVLLTYAILHVSGRGQSETVHAFLLCSACYVWYWQGPQKQKWGLAWSLAFLFLFLDVLTVGAKSVFCFYLPIFLTKAPPKIRHQLGTPAHVIPLLTFVALSFWIIQSANFPFWSWNDICYMTAEQFYNESFLHHFFTFPFKCAFYLLPWTALAWTPFCEAQKQFEPAGSVGTFFRTIIITHFIVALLTPHTSPLHLLHLIGPMAILLGFHFEVTMRRHTRFYEHLLDISAVGSMLFAFIFMVLWILTLFPACAPFLDIFTAHPAAFEHLSAINSPWMNAVYMAALLFVSHDLLVRKKATFSLGMRILISIFLIRLTALCAYYPWRAAFLEYRRPNAWLLMNKGTQPLPPHLMGLSPSEQTDRDALNASDSPPPNSFDFDRDVDQVYLQAEAPFRVETFYFNKPVYRILDPLAELPVKAKTVYFLGTRQPPVPNRRWFPVSPAVNMTPQRQNTNEQIWLTLYRGVLKTDEEMLQ